MSVKWEFDTYPSNKILKQERKRKKKKDALGKGKTLTKYMEFLGDETPFYVTSGWWLSPQPLWIVQLLPSDMIITSLIFSSLADSHLWAFWTFTIFLSWVVYQELLNMTDYPCLMECSTLESNNLFFFISRILIYGNSCICLNPIFFFFSHSLPELTKSYIFFYSIRVNS